MLKRISHEETSLYRKLDPERDFSFNMDRAIAFALYENEDGSEDVVYYGEAFIDPTLSRNNPHYVYVLVNTTLPGICKIGFTTKTVYERVREINAATGVIEPWYPVYHHKCGNGRMLEQDVHKNLMIKGVRIYNNKEGFYISSEDAKKIIQEESKKYILQNETDIVTGSGEGL